jgi:TolA-binding protein
MRDAAQPQRSPFAVGRTIGIVACAVVIVAVVFLGGPLRGVTPSLTAQAQESRGSRIRAPETAVASRAVPTEAPRALAGATDEAPPPAIVEPRAPSGVGSNASAGASAARVRPPRAKDGASPPATLAPLNDDNADAYAGAVALLTNRQWAAAAAALSKFLAAHPNDPQAEDASFLEAVALARDGRTDAAGALAERHLERFPSSFHRKDALTLVARAARTRGDCARARQALAPWLAASDPSALAELRSCSADPSQ